MQQQQPPPTRKSDKSEKLPKLIGGGTATFQSTRAESVGNRTQYQVHLEEMEKDPRERNMKKYFDALFPQTTIAHKRNRNLGRLSPIGRQADRSFETPSGGKSRRRNNLDYSMNSMSDEQSFFQAINEEISMLDQKIHKTKNYISAVTNKPSSRAGPMRAYHQQDISYDEIRSSDSRKNQRQPSPGLKALNMVPNSNRSHSIDSSKQHQKQSTQPTDTTAHKGIEGYGIGKTTGEDSEPERPTYEKPKFSLKQKPASRDSNDGHDSPLFEIAKDIENRKLNKPTPEEMNDRGQSILAKYESNTVKEEPHEENSDTHRLVTGSNGGNSKYSIQNQQKLERSEADRKSMEKKIAEVQESLNNYKKQMNKSHDPISKAHEGTNVHESDSNSKTNKRKSDAGLNTRKTPETNEKP